MSEDVWAIAASRNGWAYSATFGGWTRSDHLDPETGWSVAGVTAEDACFLDGIETEADALRMTRGAA